MVLVGSKRTAWHCGAQTGMSPEILAFLICLPCSLEAGAIRGARTVFHKASCSGAGEPLDSPSSNTTHLDFCSLPREKGDLLFDSRDGILMERGDVESEVLPRICPKTP